MTGDSISRQFPLCWGLAQRRAEKLRGSYCEDTAPREVFCIQMMEAIECVCMLIDISYYLTLPLISS